MCYSTRIKTSLKEIAGEFQAQTDLSSFESLLRQRLSSPQLRVPFGLDRYFLLSQDPAEARLSPFISAFHAEEKSRNEIALRAAVHELRALESKKPSATGAKKIGVLQRRIVKLDGKIRASFDRIDPLDDRIFPSYFAPVIVEEAGKRFLRPMRFRVQNPDGSEIPSQYNVFNARHDSLLSAKTWRPLFGKNHLIFPFQRFYEWVSAHGKKEEIYFAPENREVMWAAGLFSVSPSGNDGAISSFAMVTDNPPAEVAAAGHDRCPVFLKQEQLKNWLSPQKSSPESLLLLLRSIEKTFYLHGLAA
ncbi:MAG: SOS response-associated peptidase family protein [Bacteriovoracia bacterium]